MGALGQERNARHRLRATLSASVLSIAVVLLAACTTAEQVPGPSTPTPSPVGSIDSTMAQATSVTDAGGMKALIAAAQKEGRLNVIALPPDWANYGQLISTFEDKYAITVDSLQPDGSSQDEINAVEQFRGTVEAPDVLDLGMSVAVANTDLFAPYRVATWNDIPTAQKEPTGLWTQDYGGYMAIGYDSAKVSEPTSVTDLLKPEYKGKVAITGDPTQSNAALTAVMMASLATGGSLNDISEGIDFFRQLKQVGNFAPAQASAATIRAGTTPVVMDWDYLALAAARDMPSWKVFLPPNAVLGGYYAQAINKDAPHPAAARLWQEFLFSDEGQNLWLDGGARPVRLTAMRRAGTADRTALARLPEADAEPQFLTEAQTMTAKEVLVKDWSRAIR